MGAQGNAGGHDALLTVNNYYYLPASTPCQDANKGTAIHILKTLASHRSISTNSVYSSQSQLGLRLNLSEEININT